jgi:Tol biopolymer transport system component
MATGLQLVSVRNSSLNPSAGGNGDSGVPIISPDGRYVLFASTADNLVLTTNLNPVSGLLLRSLNVFRRDRTNGTTTLVSVNFAGTGGGNGDSLPAGISSDGQYALFESSATDLMADDTNNTRDVFVRDLIGGTTTLVSASLNGGSGNGASRSPVMTPDGRYVAFVSAATNLVAGDTNGIPDVFVRDLQGGTTVLVSAGAISTNTTMSASSSEAPVITPDGRNVAFFSTATNLVPGVTTVGDIYIRDLVDGTTVCASTSARTIFQLVLGGTDTASFNQSISSNGTYVVFETCSNAPIPAYGRGMIFRYNRASGLTDIVHANAHVPAMLYNDIRSLDLTPDGRFIAFVANGSVGIWTNTAVYLWDAQNGNSSPVSVDLNDTVPTIGMCHSPAITPDGRYVAFVSSATNLTTNVLMGDFHLYLRDAQTGVTTLLDVYTNGFGLGVSPTMIPTMSTNGGPVAFESPYANLDNRSCYCDVFVRDPATNAMALISARHPDLASLSPNGPSTFFPSSISTNGRYSTFASDANNLVAGDTNGYRDIFVRDIVNSMNLLVSADSNGVPAAGISSEPAISTDGRYVVFTSAATNLVAGDTNKATDVFVRDLQLGTNLLVSMSTNGGFGNASSFSPAISADGRYILFRSMATDLAAGPVLSSYNYFLHDLLLRTNYALTSNYGQSAAMTPDGHYVAFVGAITLSGNYLYVWDSQAARRVYTNTSVSSQSFVSISPDGRRLVYFISASQLIAADRLANTNCVISPMSSSWFILSHAGLQFSADGRFLTYAAVTNGGIPARNVYLYDFQTGSNRLVSRSFNTNGAAENASDSPAISPDGRYVAYRSFASNCVPDDFNRAADLFLYDRLADDTTLLSVNRSGAYTANNHSSMPMFSGDGQTLVFQSWASDLLAQDGNNSSDLFVYPLSSPAITDTDGDGMDDQWELDYFSTLARDGTGDFDGDGATDLFEFQTGTNPTDPTSVFRAEIVYTGTAGQDPIIIWPVALGKSYSVQFKNSLSDPGWQGLDGNVILIDGTGYATDLVPAAGQRFYRVVLLNY